MKYRVFLAFFVMAFAGMACSSEQSSPVQVGEQSSPVQVGVWAGENPFQTADPDLRSCLVTGLGEERVLQLGAGAGLIQQDLEMLYSCNLQSGPVTPSTTGIGVVTVPNDTKSDSENPFQTADPDLQSCLVTGLGEERVLQLGAGAGPTQKEMDTLNSCLSQSVSQGGSSGVTDDKPGSTISSPPATATKPVSDRQPRIVVKPKDTPAPRTTFTSSLLTDLCSGDSASASPRDINIDHYALLRVREVWDAGCTGKGSVIAVIDGGFDSSHPEFEGKVLVELCVGDEHMVGGCANEESFEQGPGSTAGETDHGTSVAGVVSHLAPEAQLIFIKPAGSDDMGPGPTSAAFKWVIANAEQYGIDAVVMSFGSSQNDRELLRRDGAKCSTQDEEKVLFSEMRAVGVVPIFASGNSGKLATMDQPACLDNVVSVGATDEYANVATFSDIAETTTLLAPSDLEVSIEDGKYAPRSGTSFTAPAVGALVAIGRQIRSDLTVEEFVAASRMSARRVDDFEVKDLRIIDFLSFSQHLAGQPSTPRSNEPLYQIDAVYQLFVGEKIDVQDDLGAAFDFPPEHQIMALDIAVIDLFGKQCEVLGEDILGAADGSCVVKVTMEDYKTDDSVLDDEGMPTELDCEICAAQKRIFEIQVREITPTDLDGTFALAVGAAMEGVDIVARVGTTFPGESSSEFEFVTGDRAACEIADFGGSIRGLAPGTCIYRLKIIEILSYEPYVTGRNESVYIEIRVQ